MDVIFEPQRGGGGGRGPFSIEVGFFDTIQEIKEKIQKYQGIPISRQTLVFKSKVLEDDCKIQDTDILQNSHIQLLLIDHHETSSNNNNNNESSSSPPPPSQPSQPMTMKKKSMIKLHIIKSSSSNNNNNNNSLTLEVEASDSIGRVKEKIHKVDDTIPIDTITLLHSSSSSSSSSDHLHDNLTIADLLPAASIDNNNPADILELRIIMQQNNNNIKNNKYAVVAAYSPNSTAPANSSSPAAATTSGGGGGGAANNINNNNIKSTTMTTMSTSTMTMTTMTTTMTTSSTSPSNKLRIMVLTKGGSNNKIPVVVNAGDIVGDLRKELERLKPQLNFYLPPEGYFFIYRQNVMDDARSYRWHHVSHGDTIEIFNGTVSGGGS